MTNLEKIRAACIEANPSILDLKFGCVFKEDGIKSLFTIIAELSNNNIQCVYMDGISGRDEYVEHAKQLLPTYESVTILGRPIRLADVLQAVDDAGHGNLVKIQRHIIGVYDYWNLKDDDLSHQSEETLQFLADLLSNSISI